MAQLHDEVDRLYALPLDEFTASRNELAGRLRAEERRDEADEVRQLAKPTVPAWAVNQLARRERPSIQKLLELADRQRDAVGRGDTDALRTAADEERRVLRELTRVARALVQEAGRGPAGATLEKIAATLRAAAADPNSRELLERGRLTRDVEATGFGALAGVTVQPAPDRKAEVRRRAKETREEVAELRRRARELERGAERAERAAAAARKAADEAREAVALAEARLQELVAETAPKAARRAR
jgi:hypothetical protein